MSSDTTSRMLKRDMFVDNFRLFLLSYMMYTYYLACAIGTVYTREQYVYAKGM